MPDKMIQPQVETDAMHDLDIVRAFTRRIDRRPDLEIAHFQQDIARFAHPRPPFRLVVRFSTQSATRFTLIASVAMATAGQSAAPMP